MTPAALHSLLARLAGPEFSVSSTGGGDDGAELVLYVDRDVKAAASANEEQGTTTTTTTTTCIELEMEPPAGMHLRRLQRCGDASGSGLLSLVDRFAVAAGVRQVTLTDDSKIFVGPPPSDDLYDFLDQEGARCDIDYASLCILATGQSFYNAHGYRSSSHDVERAHNTALIERPFGPTLRGFCADDRLVRRIEQQIVVPAGLLPLLLKDPFMADLLGISPPERFFETATTREVFAAILADHALVRGIEHCSDLRAVWINAVLKLFSLGAGGIMYNGSHLTKDIISDTASSTTPHRSKRKRLNGGSHHHRRQAATTRRASAAWKKCGKRRRRPY